MMVHQRRKRERNNTGDLLLLLTMLVKLQTTNWQRDPRKVCNNIFWFSIIHYPFCVFIFQCFRKYFFKIFPLILLKFHGFRNSWRPVLFYIIVHYPYLSWLFPPFSLFQKFPFIIGMIWRRKQTGGTVQQPSPQPCKNFWVDLPKVCFFQSLNCVHHLRPFNTIKIWNFLVVSGLKEQTSYQNIKKVISKGRMAQWDSLKFSRIEFLVRFVRVNFKGVSASKDLFIMQSILYNVLSRSIFFHHTVI